MLCASNCGGSGAPGPRKAGGVHTIVSSVRTRMVDESRGTLNHPLGSSMGPRYTNAVQIARKGMQTWVAQCPQSNIQTHQTPGKLPVLCPLRQVMDIASQLGSRYDGRFPHNQPTSKLY